MKSFLDHLKEEVLPTVQVTDGGLDIDKPAVRAAINAAIAGVVSQPAVTPYVVFNRLSKLLAQYHIVLPKRFLEGDKGVEVFELKQFGHRMGMTDSGEFVNHVPSTHYLFLQYGIITPMGVTYAKPIVGGMFRVTARLVDKAELDKLIDMAEITMSEEAECMQAIYKANAPKEEMKDITDDPKKVGNKAAVATSEKGLKEELSHGARELTLHADNDQQLHRSSHQPIIKNLSRKHAKGTYDHEKATKLWKYHADRAAKSYEKQHGGKFSVADRKAAASHFADSARDEHGFGSVKEEKNDLKDACWKGYTAKGLKKKGNRMVPNCVPVEEATDKDRELSKLANKAISKGHPVKKLPAGRAEYSTLPKGMAKGINLERGRWSGHGRFNEEVHVKSWSDGTHTAKINREGKSPHVISRKSEKDLHKEILSRYPSLKGKIPKASPVTPVKEEKGDRVVPGSLSPETMKQVQDLSRDLASGERGATFALKGNPTKTINVSSDAPERGNKVGTRAPLNEKHLTPPEKAAKEKIVLKMKPHLAKFKKRYGKSGKSVMYGAATNRAKQVAEEKKDTVLVSPKGYKGGGKVKRINKKDYDPKKHSLASE